MPLFSSELPLLIFAQCVSAALIFGGGTFVILQNPRGTLNRLFLFTTLSTLLFTIIFIMASLQTDYAQAYFWWFLNISVVFIAMSVTHFIMSVIDRARSWRPFIIAAYVLGFLILAAGLIEPHWFQTGVVPKMYFHYYLQPGWLYLVMLAYFAFFPLVAFVNLVDAYRHASGLTRRRYEFFIIMLIVGYAIGCLNFPLVFDVPIDPIYGSLIGVYLIPIAYGILSVDLMDIRIVARRALYYGVIVGGIAGALAGIPILDDYLQEMHPGLNIWVLPPFIAIIAALIGRLVWRQATEAERLKYEFITVVAHKLRTPLTRIRWTVAGLADKAAGDEALREGLDGINEANDRLIELTSLLMDAAHAGDSSYGYEKKVVDLDELATAAVARFASQAEQKRLHLTLSANGVPVIGDKRRIDSVVDVMIENAINYTPAGGTIAVAVTVERYGVRFSVTDTGIGVAPADRRHIFKSFFRTSIAKENDTEGFGLGLALAKSFIEHQHGSIGFDSEGEGKGSTFWFTLPAASEQQ